jgi:transposase
MRRTTLNNPDKIRQQILAYFSSEDPRIQYALRLQVMLLLSQDNGPGPVEIAALYGIEHHTVVRWAGKLNDSPTADIAVLEDKPMGRNTRLDKKQLDIIDQLIAQSPRKAGIAQDKWTGSVLSDYLKQHYGIALKTRMCQRWLSRWKTAAMQRG